MFALENDENWSRDTNMNDKLAVRLWVWVQEKEGATLLFALLLPPRAPYPSCSFLFVPPPQEALFLLLLLFLPPPEEPLLLLLLLPLPTSEVKRRRAQLILGWGTAWEDLRVLSAFTYR